jgi:hypothetical protein
MAAPAGEHVHGHDEHGHGPESLTDAMTELDVNAEYDSRCVREK